MKTIHAKLVLEHFHPSFLETGGQIKYKDKNRRNAKLSNLSFEPLQYPREKAFWDIYYKIRWDRINVSEEFVKPYFDHILNKESVNEFCMRYNGGDIPEEKELRQILEKKNRIQKYGKRCHSNHEIPLPRANKPAFELFDCTS